MKRTTTDHKKTRAIGTKCVFQNEQQDKSGTMRNKTRLVTKLLSLIEGLDFGNTIGYASLVLWKCICCRKAEGQPNERKYTLILCRTPIFFITYWTLLLASSFIKVSRNRGKNRNYFKTCRNRGTSQRFQEREIDIMV